VFGFEVVGNGGGTVVLDAAGELMNAAAQIFSVWLKIYSGVFHFGFCSSNPHSLDSLQRDTTLDAPILILPLKSNPNF